MYVKITLDIMGSMNGNTMYYSDDCLDDLNGKSDKRPRTVLSSSQRRVLKAAFDHDPKPSKKVIFFYLGAEKHAGDGLLQFIIN